MISCLTIDDEPSALDILEIHAKKIAELRVLNRFTNPFKARDFIRENPVDLLFLDINMPGLSGIQILDQLIYKPLVVFTTAYSEYAVDSYEYEAVDYLLKPIEFDRFQKAIDKIQKKISSDRKIDSYKPDFLFVRDGYKSVKIFLSEIEYVKSDGNYLNIYTDHSRINTRLTLKEFQQKLPGRFIRIHNSIIINLDKVDQIENNQIIISEARLTIGPNYKELIQERIRGYCCNQYQILRIK